VAPPEKKKHWEDENDVTFNDVILTCSEARILLLGSNIFFCVRRQKP